jgi:hypothetical protein
LRIIVHDSTVLTVTDMPSIPVSEISFEHVAADREKRKSEALFGLSDVTITPLDEDLAHQMDGAFQDLERWIDQPMELPAKAPNSQAYQHIPLLIEKYDQYHGYTFNGQKRTRLFVDGTINPGPIPPNFVHTWALNCKDIEKFRPHFKKIALDGEDVIKFYTRWSFIQQDAQGNSTSPLPIGYWRVKDVKAHWFLNLQDHDEDIQVNWGKSNLTYTRLYIQLETSSKQMERYFVMDGLELVSPATGKEACYLVGDDLRYEGSYGVITQASQVEYTALVPKKDAQGKETGAFEKINIYESVPLKPWWVGNNPLEMPLAKDGWYLLNQYLKDDQQGYFAITYYNESKGRLRIYLYDHNLAQLHTGFNVRVSLLGQVKKGGQYQELKGAIFPVHVNPFLWSNTTLPLQTSEDIKNPAVGNIWSANKWGAVELPFLIPMVEQVPAGAPFPHQGKKSPAGNAYYHSVYDEFLKKNMRSMKLKIEICPFDEGKITGDWTGKATGEAIQKMKDSGDDPLSTVNDWLSTGKSIVEGAKKGWDAFSDWYTKEEDPKDKGKPKSDKSSDSIKAFKATASIISTGLSVFSGGLGAAGSIVNLVGDLFGLGAKPEPLELSLKLSMQGMLKGTQLIQFTPRKIEFYLPGRFAIDEIIDNDEVSILDQAAIDSILPRYDRRLGLFGFMYNPADVMFKILRIKEYHSGLDSSNTYVACIYPTTFNQNPKYAALKPGQGSVPKEYADTLEYILPVIYNPYAELVMPKPTLVGTPQIRKFDLNALKLPYGLLPLGCYDWQWWQRKYWTYNLSFKNHIPNPEPGDTLPITPGNEEEAFYMRVTVYGEKEYSAASTIYWYDWAVPMGHTMQVVPKPNLLPQTFTDFKQVVNVEHSDHLIEIGKPWIYYDIPCWEGSGSAKEKYAPNHPAWPIYHVLFSYQQPYFYYSRSRQQANGFVPKSYQNANFKVPLTMEIKERYAEDNQLKWKKFTCYSDIGRKPS